MKDYKSPLSVYFIWHPADNDPIKPLIEDCCKLLRRDINKPFSRGMNLPVFFRTSNSKKIPSKIVIGSDKTIIFPVIGTKVVADGEWVDYLKDLPSEKGVSVIPVALDSNAFKLNNIFDNKNFIRFYEMGKKNLTSLFFISIAHEIYRHSLNERFSTLPLGSDNSLKLFLSHSKGDDWAVELAKKLKEMIDNSSMQNFFDATDIAPGYKFDSEIKGHIERSTVISIHSDSYSSRYWCQREIQHSKETKRPIIAVDCLNESEDRRYPFASNIPSVHTNADRIIEEDTLYKILSSAILETVRFYYSKMLLTTYQKYNIINSAALILPRPPEVADLSDIISLNDDKIILSHTFIAYPEPPVFSEELEFLEKINVEACTPLTCKFSKLSHLNIGISISDPSEEENIEKGLDENHLVQVSQDIARHLLVREATLIYGGDLRKSGFTEYIFEEVQILQSRLQNDCIKLKNYIAWPIYNNDTEDVTEWKAKYRNIANMVEVKPHDNVCDLIPDKDQFLKPTNSQNSYVWSCCLTRMRSEMIESCSVRICAGGKHSGYKGKMPGVLEEILISLDLQKPLYLLGGFGGVTSSVCSIIENKTSPEKITEDWQFVNNAGYKEMLVYALKKTGNKYVDYDEINKKLKAVSIKELSCINGLSDDENLKLFKTQFIDEALFLVLKGVNSVFARVK